MNHHEMQERVLMYVAAHGLDCSVQAINNTKLVVHFSDAGAVVLEDTGVGWLPKEGSAVAKRHMRTMLEAIGELAGRREHKPIKDRTRIMLVLTLAEAEALAAYAGGEVIEAMTPDGPADRGYRKLAKVIAEAKKGTGG